MNRLARVTGDGHMQIVGRLMPLNRNAVRFKSDYIGSTVDRGTRFENSTKLYLSKRIPSMELMRTGGANDGGIDLFGWWYPTSSCLDTSATSTSDRVRVIVQCKAEAKKLGPIHVREIRGVVEKMSRENTAILAVLSSASGFSKQCLLQFYSCSFPLLFLHLVAPNSTNQQHDDDHLPPTCLSMLPNEALSEQLLNGKMEIKHITSIDASGRKQMVPTVYVDGKRM